MSVSEVSGSTRRKRANERWDDCESACRFVVAAVGAAFEVDPPRLLRAERGNARVAFARGAAMYLAHVKLGMTMTEVGRQFGRDRTTVAHACTRIEDAREEKRFDALLARLEAGVDGWRRTFLEGIA